MARVYIHEFVDVIGTERARYQHHMTANWSPDAGPLRRQKCFGVFSVVGSTGRWPQVVNLWEYESWADLAHNFSVELVGSDHRDPMLAEWWRKAAAFRTGGLDRIVVAHGPSPGVDDWCSHGGTGAVAYLHEVIGSAPGTSSVVADDIVGRCADQRATLGIGCVAVFRTAMRADDEVIALWSVPDWETWARFQASSDVGGADAGGADHFRAWQLESVASVEQILLVDAELSPLRTGRQPMASDRRPLDEI